MNPSPPVEEVPVAVVLLTVEQAADALAVGRSTVYQLLEAGALRSVRIGRCRRIPVDALDELVHGLQDS